MIELSDRASYPTPPPDGGLRPRSDAWGGRRRHWAGPRDGPEAGPGPSIHQGRSRVTSGPRIAYACHSMAGLRPSFRSSLATAGVGRPEEPGPTFDGSRGLERSRTQHLEEGVRRCSVKPPVSRSPPRRARRWRDVPASAEGMVRPAPGGEESEAVKRLGGLVLTRHLGESIMIGDEVEVHVVGLRSGTVRLKIVAPRSIPVHRREVFDAIQSGFAPIESSPISEPVTPSARQAIGRPRPGAVGPTVDHDRRRGRDRDRRGPSLDGQAQGSPRPEVDPGPPPRNLRFDPGRRAGLSRRLLDRRGRNLRSRTPIG